MNSSGSKRYIGHSKEIVKGDWKVFDISNGNYIFEGNKKWATGVAVGFNHYHCLPNKQLKYFVMNFIAVFDSIKQTGGASYNMHTQTLNPTTGYMVAIPGFEKIIDVPTDLNKFQDEVVSYVINSQLWEKINTNPDGIYLGFWLHDGKLYIDLAENIATIGAAIHLGIERAQIAIYDCVKKEDIKINIELPSDVIASYSTYAELNN